jgi:hypothetical protein
VPHPVARRLWRSVVGADPAGHKENHEPVLHFPQILYFLAFTTVMTIPSLLLPDVPRALGGAMSVGLGSSLCVLC